MDTSTPRTVTILHSAGEENYSHAIGTLFQSQDIRVTEISCDTLIPNPEQLADPEFLFMDSGLLVIVLSEEFRQWIYRVPGFRAAINRAVNVRPNDSFLILTSQLWIPGFKREQVFPDVRLRGAQPIVNEIILSSGLGNFDCTFPKIELPWLIEESGSPETVEQYLLEMSATTIRSGVMAFGAILYDDDGDTLFPMIQSEEVLRVIDIAAGPHFDIFAIRDTVQYNATSTRQKFFTGVHNINRASSSTFEQFFGLLDVQVHYPSMLLYLVESESITHAALIPFIIRTKDEISEKVISLSRLVSSELRRWRKFEKYTAPDVWKNLSNSLRKAGFPGTDYPPPTDSNTIIRKFSNMITHF